MLEQTGLFIADVAVYKATKLFEPFFTRLHAGDRKQVNIIRHHHPLRLPPPPPDGALIILISHIFGIQGKFAITTNTHE